MNQNPLSRKKPSLAGPALVFLLLCVCIVALETAVYFNRVADIRQRMGGREAVALLRQTDKTLKVFVASGYSNDPIMTDPNAFGFTDKIGKPFRKGELRELFGRYFPDREGSTANS